MPEQSSDMDQQDDSTLSQVTSELRRRYWIRMMEMAQVKKPKLKIPRSIIFCALLSFSEPRAGNGTTKTMTSVKILPAALMYQKGKFGMQVPGVSGSQNFSIGVQLNMVTSSWETDHNDTKVRAAIMMRRINWVVNIL